MSSKVGSKEDDGDAVVTLLEDFFYFEDPLTERVEEWADKVSKEILSSFDNKIDEHPLSHTVLHSEYKDLFEDILSEFLLERGHTPEDFYRAALALIVGSGEIITRFFERSNLIKDMHLPNINGRGGGRGRGGGGR